MSSNDKNPDIERRRFIRNAAIIGAAGMGWVGTAASAVSSEDEVKSSKRHKGRFRFVFMSDIHLMKDRRAPDGMAAALTAATNLDPKPVFIITGGDLIDSLRDMSLPESTEIADRFVKILNENTDIPIHHLLGNHDAAGWRNPSFPKSHEYYAFGLLQMKLGMPSLYNSFDYENWHFVTLHNIRLVEPESYVSEFDDEQMGWLEKDLSRNTGKPAMIFGHFPPVSAIEFFDGRAKYEEGDWTLSAQRVSRNPMSLVNTVKNSNTKAFFSGHIHRLDYIEAMDQTFICAGSVSGNKWRGHDHDTPEGFAVVDCFEDGSFDYSYYDYGWKA